MRNPWATPDALVEPSQGIRELVFDRDGNMCAGVGFAGLVHTGLTIQHRHNRGMGGDVTVNGPEWLMLLCATCNARLEQDASFAASGRRWGWKLTEGEDPTRIAVWFAWVRQWRRLDTDGGFTRVIARESPTAPADDPFAGWREDR